MRTFIIGIAGKVGRRLAQQLVARGDEVGGLVRRVDQREELAGLGVVARIGDLVTLTARELADRLHRADAVVFSAGSNASSARRIREVDGDGLVRAMAAARVADVERFLSVSVLPESWRERDLDEVGEHYFATKKRGDIAVVHSDLDWVILRPAMLHDEPGTGRVALSPAQAHGRVARDDVAATIAALLHEPRISHQILELDQGSTVIADAVRANVRTVHDPREGRPTR